MICSGMAHFHIKKKKGRPYLYVREIARVDGKPKVISQVYIGSPEKVAALATGKDMIDKELRVESFGALWLARQIDSAYDIAGIIDGIVPPGKNETGPTVGEYFLYCVLNRMIDAVSKNKLSEWYKRTAVQQIRPVDIDALTSKRYWEKWDRVTEKQLAQMARRFFERVWKNESPDADCMLFDTSNYYTYMSSVTPSELAKRGKNKEGRHHLRQVGLGLLVARGFRLPLYYTIYPGNLHDSRHFEAIMDDMFAVVCGLNQTKERLTVVIDKGMNSENNYAWIDEHKRIHFITNYSPYFAEDIAAAPLDRFEPVDIGKNKILEEAGQHEDRVLAYRTKGHYWGKERAVVVTYNPATARKKEYTLESKLETIRLALLDMRAKANYNLAHWRKPDAILERYHKLCERLHVASDLFTLEFEKTKAGLSMRFRKNVYQVQRRKQTFGKNIIITDNTDWTTAEIVKASLDRWQVENRFRQSKDNDLVSMRPLRHWTDSKIRCHLFSCVVAMTYLRILELKLEKKGIKRTAEDVMEDMSHLHSVLTMTDGRHKPRRRIETPTKTQAEVLTAFGHRVDASGVIQKI